MATRSGAVTHFDDIRSWPAAELTCHAARPRSAVVVEDRNPSLRNHAHAPTGFLRDLLARVQVRYPETRIVFLESRYGLV